MIKNNEFITKTFVKKTVKETEKGLIGRIKKVRSELIGRIEKVRSELGEKIENLQKEMRIKHNEVIEKLDAIAGSIKKFDEEQTVLSYQVSEHTDQIENHEKRIKKIEKATLSPSL